MRAELTSAVAALQPSIAPAENPRDEDRKNIHSLRAKLTAELKSAVAALQLSIARARIVALAAVLLMFSESIVGGQRLHKCTPATSRSVPAVSQQHPGSNIPAASRQCPINVPAAASRQRPGNVPGAPRQHTQQVRVQHARTHTHSIVCRSVCATMEIQHHKQGLNVCKCHMSILCVFF